MTVWLVFEIIKSMQQNSQRGFTQIVLLLLVLFLLGGLGLSYYVTNETETTLNSKAYDTSPIDTSTGLDDNSIKYLRDEPMYFSEPLPVGTYITLCRNNGTEAQGVWQVDSLGLAFNQPTKVATYTHNEISDRCKSDLSQSSLVFTQPVPNTPLSENKDAYVWLCVPRKAPLAWTWKIRKDDSGQGLIADLISDTPGHINEENYCRTYENSLSSLETIELTPEQVDLIRTRNANFNAEVSEIIKFWIKDNFLQNLQIEPMSLPFIAKQIPDNDYELNLALNKYFVSRLRGYLYGDISISDIPQSDYNIIKQSTIDHFLNVVYANIVFGSTSKGNDLSDHYLFEGDDSYISIRYNDSTIDSKKRYALRLELSHNYLNPPSDFRDILESDGGLSIVPGQELNFANFILNKKLSFVEDVENKHGRNYGGNNSYNITTTNLSPSLTLEGGSIRSLRWQNSNHNTLELFVNEN